jgi:hypothetical protein
MKFERPTGIPAQILKQANTRIDIKEFGELHDHYRKLVQLEQTRKRITDTQSLPLYRFLSKSKQEPQFESFVRSTPIPKIHPWEVINDSIDLNQITTLDQRLEHIGNGVVPLSLKDLKPLRVPLWVKNQKNCIKCEKVLIQPDTNATSTEFSIKSMVWYVAIN